ncbi:hypothetical protein [Metaclostridioides mangenotii]|uniref:Uncharacterized protein n=1 Tax=Metaclostridioides mangenotii TaxID=1540 RepID=A0ABS4EBE3_9FIRM|nr:hypothetical protein [Clostridioides mangenotii]MBP1855244.1 hypothetical protein [Clostridioides mangenotii]
MLPYSVEDANISIYAHIGTEELIKITYKIFEYYICNKCALKFRKMLTIESIMGKGFRICTVENKGE